MSRIRAVFLDYTGTILQLAGKDITEMVTRFVRNSDDHDPVSVMNWWFTSLNALEEEYTGENYKSEEELCRMLLMKAQKEKGFRDCVEDLVQLNRNYWMYAPLFDDVKPFLKALPIPAYLLTNNSASYVNVCLKNNGITLAGIIGADDVRAAKPHRAIFERALQVSGCKAEEVLHIGDSLSDVSGAKAAGITPVLIDRKGKYEGKEIGAVRVSGLMEVLKLL